VYLNRKYFKVNCHRELCLKDPVVGAIWGKGVRKLVKICTATTLSEYW